MGRGFYGGKRASALGKIHKRECKMIDWQQVRQLRDDVGKEEMVEVVVLFLSEVDEAIENLQAEYAVMTTQDRSAAFHFLKGCAANLGFKKSSFKSPIFWLGFGHARTNRD